HEAPDRRDGAAQAGSPRRRETTLHESVDHAQRDSPGDDTLVQVHGIQRAPGWLLARPAIRIPEARVFAPGAGAPVGDGRRGTEGLEPAHRSDLVDVDVEAPANRV